MQKQNVLILKTKKIKKVKTITVTIQSVFIAQTIKDILMNNSCIAQADIHYTQTSKSFSQ